jgi:hypothetical protein
MSWGNGPWSTEDLTVFKYCFQRLEEGCKTSSEMEEDVRKKFWWVTTTSAYRLVRVWFRNRAELRSIISDDPIDLSYQSMIPTPTS